MHTISSDTVFANNPQLALLADAAANGQSELVNRLVEDGADVNGHGDRGVTPLMWAIFHGNQDGIAALCRAGAHVGEADADGTTAIHLAAGMAAPESLATLLDNAASPNTREAHRGRTPIFEAILGDRQAQFDALLDVADLNYKDKMGNSPLHTAASLGDYARVVQLIKHGADPRQLNDAGKSFQHMLPRGGGKSPTANDTAIKDREELIRILESLDVERIEELKV